MVSTQASRYKNPRKVVQKASSGKTDPGPQPSVASGTEGITINDRHEAELAAMHAKHHSEAINMMSKHAKEKASATVSG